MIEEQYLIRQIKSGSQKALETVIDRYGSYVKAIAANIIKPPMTDADIEMKRRTKEDEKNERKRKKKGTS